MLRNRSLFYGLQSRKNCRPAGVVADNPDRHKKRKKLAKCCAEHTEITFAASRLFAFEYGIVCRIVFLFAP
jgi:hypothetical protein